MGQFIEYLTNLDMESFTLFLYFWGAFGLVSGGSLFFMDLLPLSSRKENKLLPILGSINKKTGWIIMEIPILITVLYFYLNGKNPTNVSIVMVGAFVAHYINRALIYPHRIKTEGKTMAVSTMISSMTFYIINGYMIGYYFGSLKIYTIDWLMDPRFIIGLMLFISGYYINVTSDNILMKLRKPGETDYKIPQGGFFRFVSCPNYFGEMMEWTGFAIMTWSLPGLVYALGVVIPLFAQGRTTHLWYLEKFKDEYPTDRKAIIPKIM